MGPVPLRHGTRHSVRLRLYTGRPWWRVVEGLADNRALGQLREPGNAGTVPDANVTLVSRTYLYGLAGGVVALPGCRPSCSRARTRPCP